MQQMNFTIKRLMLVIFARSYDPLWHYAWKLPHAICIVLELMASNVIDGLWYIHKINL